MDAIALGAALAEAGVRPEHRLALCALHAAWWPELAPPERVTALAADYRHWLLFVHSRDGDQEAARRFERHWREAVRAFLGRGFSPDQVEELAADFFERVYRRAERFDWATPFTVFLRTVLLNLARDEVRRAQRTRRVHVPLADEPEAERRPEPRPSPEEEAIGAEQRRALEGALLRLAPLERRIVRECLLEERSGQDLAAALGLSRDALYQRLHRAKLRLRRLLAQAPVSDG